MGVEGRSHGSSQISPSEIVRAIMDSLPAGIYAVDERFRVLWVNLTLLRWIRQSDTQSPVGSVCYKKFLDAPEPCPECPVRRSSVTRKMESSCMCIDFGGRTKYYRVVSTPMGGPDGGDHAHFIVMVQDVTEQTEAWTQLERITNFNRTIIQNAPIAIFTLDRDGNFTSVNPALGKISGLGARVGEKLIGFNWRRNPYTIRCGLAKWIEKGLKGESFEISDFPFITYRGDKKIFINFKGIPLKSEDGSVEGLLCLIEDTTEKVRMKRQLLKEAKISAVAKFASAFAHNLNGPLATILAHSELLLRCTGYTHDPESLEHHVRVIHRNAMRCLQLAKQLLHVTHQGGLKIRQVNLEQVLGETLELVHAEKEFAPITMTVCARNTVIRGDHRALKLAILNILKNAFDAIEEKEQGRIWITLKEIGVDHVAVEIADNGIGIPQWAQGKVFDPFFTTKASRGGLGLGLTIAYELIEKMGGRIDIESIEGKGTTCRIILPILRKEGHSGSERVEHGTHSNTHSGG